MEERARFISLACANPEPLEFARAFIPLALVSSLDDGVLKTLFRLGIRSSSPMPPLVPSSSCPPVFPPSLPLPPPLPNPASPLLCLRWFLPVPQLALSLRQQGALIRRLGTSSLQLHPGVKIPWLHLQPPSPGIHLGPPNHRLHLGSWLPRLHRGSSSHQLHQAPSSLRLRLGQSSTIRRLRTPLLCLRLVTPSLRLCQAPPSLQLHLCPPSLRVRHGIPDPRLHLSRLSRWLRLGPPEPRCHPGSPSARLHPGRPPPSPVLLLRRGSRLPGGGGNVTDLPVLLSSQSQRTPSPGLTYHWLSTPAITHLYPS